MQNSASLLDWIDFGKVSAERDDLLSRYFVDNGVLQKITTSPSSFLVLGRKGAGKTAVFKYLKENSRQFIGNDDILVPLSFEDYNWSVHSLLVNQNKAESMLYKQSWRFIILVECIKAYRTWFEERNNGVPKGIATSSKLLEKVFASPIPSISQIVGRKLLSLSAFKLPKGGFDLESGELDSLNLEGGEITFDQVQKNNDLKTILSENIENLTAHLERAVAFADKTWPTIYVCFDRVDEAWDDVSFESSRRVIAGLVAACDAINSQYKEKIRPIVFLREDIFDVLSINDSNKLREDCGSLLHWDKNSLSNMILKRINYFGSVRNLDPISSIDSIFDKSEMRQRAKPSNYLLRRTMMRPRDLISLLSRVVDAMKEKANDPFADEEIAFEKLECESVYSAEPGYSEWLKQEILDEWKVQKPEISDLFASIQNNGSTNITRFAIEEQMRKLGKETSSADVLSHLRFLFDNSIIGFKLGSSTEWRFKCFYPSQGFVESDEYRVHEGLVRALNLTEPRGRESS
ncbi:P-loop ATPase, Sll1717 family [Microvirga sp. 2TAF3]|uniref:P-loop ATPase, Sll1717 family n=1 Tax=Microvirga sp. 2TAF3 TaxID=3233014 RepID=UPI003F98410B